MMFCTCSYDAAAIYRLHEREFDGRIISMHRASRLQTFFYSPKVICR
jgi:hypothetical protein